MGGERRGEEGRGTRSIDADGPLTPHPPARLLEDHLALLEWRLDHRISQGYQLRIVEA